MNQELLTQQWLAEIQTLKQQLAEVTKDRDAGWESAEKWRKLYNTESEQRRTDTQLSQQEIASLKAEIQKLRGVESGLLDDTTVNATANEEIAPLTSTEELQGKLLTAIQERDRLKQALKTEQENHEQTRKSLTNALGDAIDRLTQERGG